MNKKKLIIRAVVFVVLIFFSKRGYTQWTPTALPSNYINYNTFSLYNDGAHNSILNSNGVARMDMGFTGQGYIDFILHTGSGQRSNVLHMTGDGFVGIGTGNPNAMLDILTALPSVGTYETQHWKTDNANYNLKLQTEWDNNNGINYNFIQRFNGTDYSSLSLFKGNVGIGNTAPAYRLDIGGGNIRITNVSNPTMRITNSGYVVAPAAFTKTGKLEFENNVGDKVSYIYAAVPTGGYHTLGIGITTKSAWNGVENENLFCHPNGYVGIGITNPLNKLQIGTNPGNFSGNDIVISNSNGSFAIHNTATETKLASNARNISIGASGVTAMYVKADGKVGIGTINPQAMLAVNGDVFAKKVKVTQTGWADFVFETDYSLRPLSEVELYIKQYKHLPEIPSADDVVKNDLDLGEMNKMLLMKLEEVTLYLIEMEKKNNMLTKRIETLEKLNE